MEIDSICCDDAAIIISDKKIVERAFLWGNLLEKTDDLEYKILVKTKFYSYLSLIYVGLDNTPSFDFTSGKFNKKLFDSMIEIIKEYPDSKAAKEFKAYTALLNLENYKLTDKVDEYLRSQIKIY